MGREGLKLIMVGWEQGSRDGLRPPPSASDEILSVRRPLPSLRRTESKKIFRPTSFTVRRPHPSHDGRPRPASRAATPGWEGPFALRTHHFDPIHF